VVILSNGRIIADDSVEELVGVFESQAYRLTVDGRVPDHVRSELTATFHIQEWEPLEDRTSFEVTLGEADTLYGVLDVLQNSDCSLLDVASREIDLEDVFLEVTDRAHDVGDSPGGGDEK